MKKFITLLVVCLFTAFGVNNVVNGQGVDNTIKEIMDQGSTVISFTNVKKGKTLKKHLKRFGKANAKTIAKAEKNLFYLLKSNDFHQTAGSLYKPHVETAIEIYQHETIQFDESRNLLGFMSSKNVEDIEIKTNDKNYQRYIDFIIKAVILYNYLYDNYDVRTFEEFWNFRVEIQEGETGYESGKTKYRYLGGAKLSLDQAQEDLSRFKKMKRISH